MCSDLWLRGCSTKTTCVCRTCGVAATLYLDLVVLVKISNWLSEGLLYTDLDPHMGIQTCVHLIAQSLAEAIADVPRLQLPQQK